MLHDLILVAATAAAMLVPTVYTWVKAKFTKAQAVVSTEVKAVEASVAKKV